MISLCLQCCPFDVEAAIELTRLIVKTQKERKAGAEFFLIYRKDCPTGLIKEFQAIAGQKFKALACVARNHDTGWPGGSNMLAASAFIEMEILRRNDTARNEAFLLFEPDCIPMAEDWIEQLSSEWDRAKSLGKEATGHWHQQGDGSTLHMNGNAIFRFDYFERHPTTIVGCGTQGWDYWFRDRIIPISCDTYAIYQLYQRPSITVEELATVTKHGRRPALLHGIKGSSGRKAAEELIFPSQVPANQQKALGILKEEVPDAQNVLAPMPVEE
jgi:hypothetical protein